MNAKNLKMACYVGMATGLLPLSALAQQDVTIYGLMHVSMEHAWTTDATLGVPAVPASQVSPAAYKGINSSANRMSSNSSRLGFRGTEELGGGLKAVWQLEGGVSVDTGAGSLFTRNSGVGLSGSVGRVMVGNWDTPYKQLTIPLGAFVSPTAADGQLIGNPGFGIPATAGTASPAGSALDASFDRRQANTVQYWSPVAGGFSVNLAVALGETTGRKSVGILSGALSYENGPLTLQYGREQHSDYFGLAQLGGAAYGTGNTSSKDTGDKLVAKYEYRNTTIKAAAERLSYRNSDTASAHINEYRRNALLLVLEQRMGAGKLWLSYGKADAGHCERIGGTACVTNGLDATSAGLGYLYDLSKRTSLYSYYDTVRNGAAGRYGLALPVGNIEPGSKSQIVSLGLAHRF